VAVNLVGQEDIGEDWSLTELNSPRLGRILAGAENVAGQEIGGELQTAKFTTEATCDRFRTGTVLPTPGASSDGEIFPWASRATVAKRIGSGLANKTLATLASKASINELVRSPLNSPRRMMPDLRILL